MGIVVSKGTTIRIELSPSNSSEQGKLATAANGAAMKAVLAQAITRL